MKIRIGTRGSRLAIWQAKHVENVLINQGNFKWKVEPPSLSNFIADGDKKSIATIVVANKKVVLISENNGYLQAMTYQQTTNSNVINFQTEDWFYTTIFSSSVTGLIAAYIERPRIVQILKHYEATGERLYLARK